MKRKRLLVISHTKHFVDKSGSVVGWGPTVREINYLAEEFDHIYHVACFHKGESAPPSSAPYTASNITFVPLPPAGGEGMYNKFKIVAYVPIVLSTILKYLRKVDVFQIRTPTGMGVYLLPFFTFFVRKSGWFKYAGNWNQQSPPLSYRFQRFWLAYCQKRKVTINGKWEDQPKHCISFENPCLTTEDCQRGAEVIKSKNYSAPLVACFAGRLEDAKGVGRILEALQISKHSVEEVHFLGNGPDKSRYEKIANKLNIDVFFHGFSSREKIFEIFSKSHIFFLPSSASEGFPKVIAEAANFGCVPIVSNVSAIPHYVSVKNGFVWDPAIAGFSHFFNTLDLEPSRLENMAKEAHAMAEEFTFEKYLLRIRNLVGND